MASKMLPTTEGAVADGTKVGLHWEDRDQDLPLDAGATTRTSRQS